MSEAGPPIIPLQGVIGRIASPPRKNVASNVASPAAGKRPASDGNPAFRAMGLPRLRLPSRNWLIFLSITASFASAVLYDKYQTRRIKQKWCDTVSHLTLEPLDTKTMPRKLTIYLAAPPGDGLRSAREHFHEYVKPVLVAGAMDWDVIEGRKEGDVRFKTAEKVRRKRKRGGEGDALPEEEMAKEYGVELIRERNGTVEGGDVSGDVIIGRHAWKEYVRGLHEGWLGPVDAPKVEDVVVVDGSEGVVGGGHDTGHSSVGDTAVKKAGDVAAAARSSPTPFSPLEARSSGREEESPFLKEEGAPIESEMKTEEAKKEGTEEEEKPKRRHPPPYINPSDYPTAQIAASTPEILDPATAIPFPHLLGIRNTPIRIYRFLNRRHLADRVGRDVAAAVLGSSYRSYGTATPTSIDEASASATGGEKTVPEQSQVLAYEEREWWKTVRRPREEHEESVWIEDVVVDERIGSRMRGFELGAEDEERSRGFAEGRLKTVAEQRGEEEG
ncbi:mitochondrial import inner membrane translocase subunit tim54 [Recurvomyces mirabilis]|uniref:Mitochondrial import inner membrane translocase subunit TIM54 n=1 Tax=Recurvomyces mirabilis TaxID=574656 RepID=A0AAE0WFJ2_9PEZI|nr:mitochondrial import inner membrane translocase subunit tim54 [Recurvomyces mirabilis]KAK5159753.1 mitochondrial import inner membrane translocase subunit tim54 [Recurvomyces mirabilis]